MSTAAFKSDFPPIRRLQGYALHRSVTGIFANFTDNKHVRGLFLFFIFVPRNLFVWLRFYVMCSFLSCTHTHTHKCHIMFISISLIFIFLINICFVGLFLESFLFLHRHDCVVTSELSFNTSCWNFEGCLTVHRHHEIKWNANLMPQYNLLKFP